jgi:hypothetical protein
MTSESSGVTPRGHHRTHTGIRDQPDEQADGELSPEPDPGGHALDRERLREKHPE